MTSATAITATSTDVLGSTVEVGDLVWYAGSIAAAHGFGRIVEIHEGPTQPGALFADWTRFVIKTAAGTLEGVRPASILTQAPA